MTKHTFTHKRTPPTTHITDKRKSHHSTHPLRYITTQQAMPRLMKQTTFNNANYTTYTTYTTYIKYINYININPNTINQNKLETHTQYHGQHIPERQKSQQITNIIPLSRHHPKQHPQIHPSYASPTLLSYLNKIYKHKHPSPLFLLCKTEPHACCLHRTTHNNTHI